MKKYEDIIAKIKERYLKKRLEYYYSSRRKRRVYDR